MRKNSIPWVAWLALSLVVAPAATPGQVINLVQNASFEEDEVISGDPAQDKWCTWGYDTGVNSTVRFDKSECIHGVRSLRVDPPALANGYFAVAYAGLPQQVGAKYTASFWAKGQGPRPLTACMKAADRSVTWGVTDFQLTADWAEYWFTAPALNATAQLEILCAGSTIPLWLDFVAVYEGQYVPRLAGAAADWPQFRGLQRDGVSRETGLLQTWPPGGPPLAWERDGLGEGYSTPSVAGGRVFGMSYRGDDEVVWALQESDGKELWNVRIAAANRRIGVPDGARATPTIAGGYLYTLGVSGDLVCLEVDTGKVVWQKNLVRDYGGKVPSWGYSESPLVDGQKIVVTPGQDAATLVALNRNSGATLWRCPIPQAKEAQYSSVMAAVVNGQSQYVQILLGRVVGVSADDGRLLWQWDKPISRNYNCASVIVHGDTFYAPGFHTAGGVAKIVPQAGGWYIQEWFVDAKHKCASGGMVLVKGFLYGDHDGNLCCSEFASGRMVWEDRRAYALRTRRGAIAYAADRLYYRREDGTMYLVQAGSNAFVEHGQFVQPNRSDRTAFPPPVLANGRLYLRDQDLLLCYDVKQK